MDEFTKSKPQKLAGRTSNVLKAKTTQDDVIRAAMTFWECAEMLQDLNEPKSPYHNDMQRCISNLVYRMRAYAKTLDVAYGRHDAFKTYQQTQEMYLAMKQRQKIEQSKRTVEKSRVKVSSGIKFS